MYMSMRVYEYVRTQGISRETSRGQDACYHLEWLMYPLEQEKSGTKVSY